MQPLTPEDVIAAQRHMSLSSAIEALVKAAVQGIDGVKPVKHRGITPRALPDVRPHRREVVQRSRAASERPIRSFSTTTTRTGLRIGLARRPFAPASPSTSRPRPRATHSPMRAGRRAFPTAVTVGGSGKFLRVVRTKYLSELIVAGATFDEQARELGLWANKPSPSSWTGFRADSSARGERARERRRREWARLTSASLRPAPKEAPSACRAKHQAESERVETTNYRRAGLRGRGPVANLSAIAVARNRTGDS